MLQPPCRTHDVNQVSPNIFVFQKFWNKSGVGIRKSDSGHLWCVRRKQPTHTLSRVCVWCCAASGLCTKRRFFMLWLKPVGFRAIQQSSFASTLKARYDQAKDFPTVRLYFTGELNGWARKRGGIETLLLHDCALLGKLDQPVDEQLCKPQCQLDIWLRPAYLVKHPYFTVGGWSWDTVAIVVKQHALLFGVPSKWRAQTFHVINSRIQTLFIAGLKQNTRSLVTAQ